MVYASKPLPKRKSSLRLDRFEVTLVLLAVLLFMFFAIISPNFLSPFNLVTILTFFGVYYLASMGETFVIMAGSLDLSYAGVLSLSGVVSAMIICNCVSQNLFGVYQYVSPWTIALAIAAGMAVGVLFGFVNGLLLIKARIPSFLVTLGTLYVALGFGNMLTPSGLGVPLNHQLDFLLTPIVPGVSTLFLWAAVAGLLLWYLAKFVRFGWKVYAVGSDDRSAALSGISLDRTRLLVFVMSGALGGLTGILLDAYVEAASPGTGQSLLFVSLIIVVLGGTSLAGGTGGPHKTALGAFIIEIILNGLALRGVPAWGVDVFEGAAVILTMAALSRGVKSLVM